MVMRPAPEPASTTERPQTSLRVDASKAENSDGRWTSGPAVRPRPKRYQAVQVAPGWGTVVTR